MTGQARLKGYAKTGGRRSATYTLPRGSKAHAVTPAQRRRLIKKNGLKRDA
jgi:hypothetical protein